MLAAILFDLDGTLIDTAPELADALNDTLARIGRPAVDDDLVRGWIGDGARALLAKALAHAGLSAAAMPDALASLWPSFSLSYTERCGSRSVVHAGVRPMLRRLRQQGVRLAVLTNKEGAFAHRLLAAHDLTHEFDLLVAGDMLAHKKPHPAMVDFALQALDVPPDEALLVGDSAVDVRTARAAGIAVQIVRHGYAPEPLTGADAPDAFIDHFDRFAPHTERRLAIA